MMHLVLSGGKILKLNIKKIEIMAILKYGNNILTYNGNALEAEIGPAPSLGGYWKHKDTNAVTYFGLDADFITDGVMNQPSWWYDCSEVQIPSGVTGLGDECFYGCSSLTSITLPESVTSLGVSCFEMCSSLTSITLPESVTSLGNSCFVDCLSLTLVTALPATPPTLGSNAFNNVSSSFNIKVRSPYVNDYKTATNWETYADKISAIGAGYWVHKDTGVVTEITLIWQDGFEVVEDPPIVKWNPSIATSWDSVNASEIKFPEGVEEVGFLTDAFTPNIIKADLPTTTTSLGHTALNGITMMETLIIRALVPPAITLGIPQSPNLRVYVPSESLALYKSTEPYSSFAEIILAIP